MIRTTFVRLRCPCRPRFCTVIRPSSRAFRKALCTVVRCSAGPGRDRVVGQVADAVHPALVGDDAQRGVFARRELGSQGSGDPAWLRKFKRTTVAAVAVLVGVVLATTVDLAEKMLHITDRVGLTTSETTTLARETMTLARDMGGASLLRQRFETHEVPQTFLENLEALSQCHPFIGQLISRPSVANAVAQVGGQVSRPD
jgi:hypothetical protein